MSLFDDASLAMIPSAYKDGKLYSIKPTDGSGDFTFTRGSNLAATRVDENGLIEKGRENLLLQSNQFNTTWGNSNSTETSGQSGYDGSTDAWRIDKTASGGYLVQGIGTGGVQTFSVYAKAGTTDWMQLLTLGSGTGSRSVFYDLTNGVIGSQGGSGTYGIDSNIESVGGGWYRCSLTFNTTLNDVRIYPAEANSVSASSGSIYIQDAQLELGLVATDYIETTTTTAQAGILEDMPRLDYSGGASCPSLLLEPQRTNLVPYSEYFGDWGTFRSSLTANNATSPENYTNSYKLIQQSGETTSGGTNKGISVSTSTAYTYSFFAKAAGYNWCYARVIHSSDNFYAWFDLDNGVVGNTTGSGVTSSIEDYGSGWYKCSITYTSTTTLSNLHIYIAEANGSATLSNPDGVKGINIYGAQLEQASYPTSYIPSYGTSQTRSVDSCLGSFDGDNIFDSNWTAMVEMIVPSQGSTGTSAGFGARLVEGSTSSSDWSFVLAHSIGGLSLKTYNPITDNNIAYNFGDTFKLIVRSDGYYFYNGVKYTLYGLSSNEPVEIGFGRAGQTDFSAGETAEIKQVLTFPTALTDSECIALTTI